MGQERGILLQFPQDPKGWVIGRTVEMVEYQIMVCIQSVADFSQVQDNSVFQETFHDTFIPQNALSYQEKAEDRTGQAFPDIGRYVFGLFKCLRPVYHQNPEGK